MKGTKLLNLNNLLIISSFIFIFFLTKKEIVFGSSAGRWVYPYINDVRYFTILLAFLVISISFLLLHLTYKYIEKHEVKIILLWFIAGFIFQIILRSEYPYSFKKLIVSDGTNSFYTPTLRYSFYYLISNFNLLVHKLPLHAGTNMPGKIVLFYLLKLVTSSPQIMGYLIIILSNLGAILTYYISKILFKDKLIAIYSLILYIFIPSKLSFFPILNTVSPLFMLIALFLLLKYLETINDRYLFLFGISIYIILFFEPLPLVCAPIFLGLLAKYYFEKKVNKYNLLKVVIYPLFSFCLIDIIFFISFKYDVIKTFKIVASDAVNFNIRARRIYTHWITANLKDFFITLGITQSIIFFFTLFIIFKDFITKSLKRDRLKFIFFENIFPISFLLVLIFTNFVGINRGEVPRLWIFLAIFVQIIVSFFIVKKLDKESFYIVLISTILQSAISIRMVGFLVPIG